jgi:hypothetical protein
MKRFLAMMFTLGLIACPSNAPGPVPATDITIGSSGGTVSSSNGKASLVIPAGAIVTAGKWKILPVANSALPVLPTLEPYELVDGSAFEVQADNPALSKEAEFSTDSTGFPTTAGLSASFGVLTYSSATNAWSELLSSVANAKYSVTCTTCKTFVLYKRQQVLWVPNYNTGTIKGYSSKQRNYLTDWHETQRCGVRLEWQHVDHGQCGFAFAQIHSGAIVGQRQPCTQRDHHTTGWEILESDWLGVRLERAIVGGELQWRGDADPGATEHHRQSRPIALGWWRKFWNPSRFDIQ